MDEIVGEIGLRRAHAGYLGQPWSRIHIAVVQAVAIGVLGRNSAPARTGKCRCSGPCEGQAAGEIMARPAPCVAYDHISNAAALGPW